MEVYDWIVVGAGITGTALSYELAKKGFKVGLFEQNSTLNNATRYSYGGLAYWSGTTELTRTLCQEGKQRYSVLSEELETDLEFRELDLVLTFDQTYDPDILGQNYDRLLTPPQRLTIAEACELEPLLNPNAIAGAFTVPHGHISPEKLNSGYLNGFLRSGGNYQIEQVIQLIQKGDQIIGVQTQHNRYFANQIVICAGGWSRSILKSAGISMRLYFTHTEVLETPPVDLKLRTIVMSAGMERFKLETEATQEKLEPLWDKSGQELAPFIIDKSAVQLLDGRIRMGQPSRTLSDVNVIVDQAKSEALIRAEVGKILPPLENLSARWYHCLVAFSRDHLPLVGEIPGYQGIYLFSGFSNPLVFVPPLAQRFAETASKQTDPLIIALSPSRFL